MDNRIKNSRVDPSAKIYRDVSLSESDIKAGCVIADGCDLVQVTMQSHSELGRRSLARKVDLGEGSYAGSNAIIKNASIGKYCSIAWNVSIGGRNHAMNSASMYTPYWWQRTFDVELEDHRIPTFCTIGSDVWIGSGATVVSGVSIGHGAVVAAGAVVVKDVPAYSVVAGVPAKVISYRFDEETRGRLLRLAWWDWPQDRIALAAKLLSRSLDELTLQRLEGLK